MPVIDDDVSIDEAKPVFGRLVGSDDFERPRHPCSRSRRSSSMASICACGIAAARASGVGLRPASSRARSSAVRASPRMRLRSAATTGWSACFRPTPLRAPTNQSGASRTSPTSIGADDVAAQACK